MHLRLLRVCALHAGHHALLLLPIPFSPRARFLSSFSFSRQARRGCYNSLRAAGWPSVRAFLKGNLQSALDTPIPHACHLYVHSNHSFPQDGSGLTPGFFLSNLIFYLLRFVSPGLSDFIGPVCRGKLFISWREKLTCPIILHHRVMQDGRDNGGVRDKARFLLSTY